MPFLAFHLDPSTGRFHGEACQREAQAESAAGSRSSGVDAIETLEDPIAMEGRNPGPVVFDLDCGFRRREPSHANVDFASRWRVLDGVVDEVEDCLAEQRRVAARVQRGGHLDQEQLLLLLRQHAQLLGGTRRETAKVGDRV